MKRAYAVRRSRAADWARLCGGLAVPVLALAALGMRAGFIPPSALLPVLVFGFVLGLLALGIAVYALTDIWNNGAAGASAAVAGIVYAAPALVLLGLIATAAILYPRLTDITTNPEDPPEFIAGGAVGGPPEPEDLVRQQEAYPDLTTRNYPRPLSEVYAAVRDIVEERGWTIRGDTRPAVMAEAGAEVDRPQIGETDELARALARKRIMTQSRRGAARETASEAGPDAPQRRGKGNDATLEATARSLLFGFPDVVVVRLRGSAEGTDVDVRSVSVMGEHDLGQNARRIKSFFTSLDAELQPDASSATGLASVGQ